MNKPNAHADFNTLINAPKFSDGPVGHHQKKRWQLIAEDIYKSTSKEALLEARGRAEGYIHGLVGRGAFVGERYRPRLSCLEHCATAAGVFAEAAERVWLLSQSEL